jgi:hypothetical protein
VLALSQLLLTEATGKQLILIRIQAQPAKLAQAQQEHRLKLPKETDLGKELHLERRFPMQYRSLGKSQNSNLQHKNKKQLQ